MAHGRSIRWIQFVLIVAVVLVSTALFGAVEILPQVGVVLAGLLLLALALFSNEANSAAIGKGRTAGDRWLFVVAAGAAIPVLQLVPLPPSVRAVVAPGGSRLEAEVLPRGEGPFGTWSDLFAPDTVSVPEITTEELWSGASSTSREADPPSRSVRVDAPPTDSGPAKAWRPLSVAPGATRASLALLLAYAGVFFATVSVMRDERLGVWLVDAMPAVAFLIAFVGILQDVRELGGYYGLRDFGPGANPYGPFANRNHFAAFEGLVFPLVFYRSIYRFEQARELIGRARRQDLFNAFALAGLWSLAAFVMALAIVRSLSRGGVVSIVAATLVAAPFALSRLPRPRRLVSMAVVLLIAGLATSFFMKGKVDDLAARTDESIALGASGRLAMANSAIRQWSDFPILGSGLGTFPWTSGLYKPPTADLALERAHNDYAEWLAETGLIGGVVVILLLAFFALEVRRTLRGARRRYRVVTVSVVAGLCSLLLHEFVDFSLQVPAVAMLAAVLCGIVVGLGRCGYRGKRRDDTEASESPLERGLAEADA